MPAASARTFHYIRSWLTGRDDLVTAELTLDRDGVQVPATLVSPRASSGPLPAWVVLHGITRPGRDHAQLVRFTRAVAAGGCTVLIPEVPEWRELDLAPTLTLPTVLASVRTLEARASVAPERIGLVGFSFGAPQALAAAGHPDLRHRLAGVVGFGGYCDLERTILFQLTGRHEWEGREHFLRPDPYGRWIVAANYVTSVPGLEDAGDVACGTAPPGRAGGRPGGDVMGRGAGSGQAGDPRSAGEGPPPGGVRPLLPARPTRNPPETSCSPWPTRWRRRRAAWSPPSNPRRDSGTWTFPCTSSTGCRIT